MAPRPLKDQSAWILDYLRDEALGGYGWRRRGVRGWRMVEEIEEAISIPVPELLPALHRGGWVDRTRVDDPGRSSPLYLYRISSRGMQRLYREEDVDRPPDLMEPAPEEEDPEAGSLFVPQHEWAALATLRRYALQQLGPRRWDQYGWLTAREIAGLERRAIGEIMIWLRARGLVERRQAAQGSGGTHPLWIYRASDLGLRARLADAVPILHETPKRVQVLFTPPSTSTDAR